MYFRIQLDKFHVFFTLWAQYLGFFKILRFIFMTVYESSYIKNPLFINMKSVYHFIFQMTPCFHWNWLRDHFNQILYHPKWMCQQMKVQVKARLGKYRAWYGFRNKMLLKKMIMHLFKISIKRKWDVNMLHNLFVLFFFSKSLMNISKF